jgi:LacI family transcriptional regulator
MLRKGSSNELALISNLPLSLNDAEMTATFQQEALLRGFLPVTYYLGNMDEEERAAIYPKILARRPYALFGLIEALSEKYIAMARQMGTEHIIVMAPEPFTASDLVINLTLPTWPHGHLAARHLLARGHRKLALVSPQEARHLGAFGERLAGMKAALEESGQSDVRLDILPMQLTAADAERLVTSVLEMPDPPTAIYAFNDEYALPLMGALLDKGLKIPQDMAILGTDNVSFSEFVRPALTTMTLDNISFGQRAIGLLLALQKDEPVSPHMTTFPLPELIQRAST